MENIPAIIIGSYWIVSMAGIIVWLKISASENTPGPDDSPVLLVLFGPVVLPVMLPVWAFFKLDDWLKTPLKKHALPPPGDSDLEEARKEIESLLGHPSLSPKSPLNMR